MVGNKTCISTFYHYAEFVLVPCKLKQILMIQGGDSPPPFDIFMGVILPLRFLEGGGGKYPLNPPGLKNPLPAPALYTMIF